MQHRHNNIRKKRFWKRFWKTVFTIIIILAAAFAFSTYAVPEINYQIALKYVYNGQYVAAIEIFTELGDYKDSKEQLAVLYNKVNNYVKVGAKAYYGRYEQDNDTTNGKETIAWQVLALDYDKVLLISDKNLDCIPYNLEDKEVTWETCTLRSWLNTEFFYIAFTAEEQAKIKTVDVINENNSIYSTNGGGITQDKVFLLSIEEANNYFKSDGARIGTNTLYAIKQNAFNSPDGAGWWWLRSPGVENNIAANVNYSGDVDEYGNYIYSLGGTVRPVFWIDQKDLIPLS